MEEYFLPEPFHDPESGFNLHERRGHRQADVDMNVHLGLCQ